MPIKDVCQSNVVTAGPESSLADAARLMKDSHVGAIVVVSREKGRERPIGLLTDRDIVNSVIANGVDPRVVTVKDIMSMQLEVIDEDTGVFEAIRKLRACGVRRMPVVNGAGELVGLTGVDDLLALVAEELGQLAEISIQQRVQEGRNSLLLNQ